jgi:anti-sigma factor ChrR (cupin superfamily)
LEVSSSELNLNFTQKVVIETPIKKGIEFPTEGFKMILLEGSRETEHITSIISYNSGSINQNFNQTQGEEIFVLSGNYINEFGEHPAGTYLRIPPGSSYQAFNQTGCTLFIKINQFNGGDNQKTIINTNEQKWLQGHGNLQVMPLHHFRTEGTALVKWPTNEKFVRHSHYGGEEILVLSGKFQDEHGSYPKLTWIRSNHLSVHRPWVEEETVILVKTGHLPTQ